MTKSRAERGMINLFYLSQNTTGGWVTFTSHLCRVLSELDVPFTLFKIGNRSERNPRNFGYGLGYHNISLADALRLDLSKAVIVAAAKQLAEPAKALIAAGAKVVLHDPTELRAGLAGVDIQHPWVIRRAVQRQVPGSVFIRHPYVRQRRPEKLPKRKGAVSISRIDFDKHTEIILDANRLGAGIRIHGFENRLYTRFKICPNYPEWKQSIAHYPREHDAAFNLLLGAKFMVDMSVIVGDGGGTQYTTLEAWDAGTVPIINYDWLISKPKDDLIHAYNCYAVGNAQELRNYACITNVAENLVSSGYASLRAHAPKKVGPQIMEWINAR